MLFIEVPSGKGEWRVPLRKNVYLYQMFSPPFIVIEFKTWTVIIIVGIA